VAQAAEARARLLERRNETAHAAGGDALNAWNREIMSLGVDTAELQAKLDRLNQRLAGYQKVVDDLDELESLSEARRHAEEALRDASHRLRQIERELASIRPPRSILLESTDGAWTPGAPPSPPQAQKDQ
jgi:predicted  nucleic acid-binding Zn-ribbon protein